MLKTTRKSAKRRRNRAYPRLVARLQRLDDFNTALKLLHWDTITDMPAANAAVRNRQIGTLSEYSQKLFASPRTRKLIQAARRELRVSERDSAKAVNLRLLAHDYAEATRIPAQLLADMQKVQGAAMPAWQEARAKSDFSIMQPHLERLVDVSRRYGKTRGFKQPYDGLLDKFEPGMTPATVRNVFAQVKAKIEPLRLFIAERTGAVDDSCLRGTFDVEAQQKFCQELVLGLGMPADRACLGITPHPLTNGINSPTDVRLSTRYRNDEVIFSSRAAIHEFGHALYELDFDPAFVGLPMAEAASMATHESQSRLWENHVGRAPQFWVHWYPRFQSRFPQFKDVSLDTFLRAMHKVQPSFIRVESDEVHYALHIILRFEIESALIDGTLEVSDLPKAWNDRFESMFGIRPKNDAEGCLQDPHWSMGAFGYFPTYLLGTIMAAQQWEQVVRAHPDVLTQMEKGEYSALSSWLKENIHQHGRRYSAEELMQRACGSAINPDAFINYLVGKYKNGFYADK